MTGGWDLAVAIVGTGVGGTERAGDLGPAGRRVRVHDVRPEAVSGIRARGGLDGRTLERMGLAGRSFEAGRAALR